MKSPKIAVAVLSLFVLSAGNAATPVPIPNCKDNKCGVVPVPIPNCKDNKCSVTPVPIPNCKDNKCIVS